MEGILNTSAAVARPAVTVKPPEARPKPDATEPRRVRTSSIEPARVIHRVEPAYPPVARIAHVSGTVEITGVIGTDGRIRELRSLSGNPLLVGTAIERRRIPWTVFAAGTFTGAAAEACAHYASGIPDARKRA